LLRRLNGGGGHSDVYFLSDAQRPCRALRLAGAIRHEGGRPFACEGAQRFGSGLPLSFDIQRRTPSPAKLEFNPTRQASSYRQPGLALNFPPLLSQVVMSQMGDPNGIRTGEFAPKAEPELCFKGMWISGLGFLVFFGLRQVVASRSTPAFMLFHALSKNSRGCIGVQFGLQRFRSFGHLAKGMA